MTIEILDNLKKDLELLKRDKFHEKHQDLINMVFNEDIPELIEFVRKVNKLFENKYPMGSGQTYQGAKDEFEGLKRQIYGT